MSDTTDFDQLDYWGSLSDNDLRQQFAETSRNALMRMLQELASEESRGVEVRPDNFVELVKQVRDLKRSGARSLGDAIIKAGKLIDEGLVEEARIVYQESLGACDSRFYRQIALDQLKSLANR